MRRVTPYLLALACVGCRPAAKRTTTLPSAFKTIAYNDAPVSPRAKVFLVAGGDDIANFAAEVVEQRELWLAAGMKPDEIECYYAQPTKDAWRDDRRQYQGLAEALRRCHRADPGRLRADLEVSATNAPPFVYIYVTAHGLPSQIPKDGSQSRRVQGLRPDEIAFFEQPAIGLDAGPAPRMGALRKQLRALRSGKDRHDILLTPAALAASLRAFPDESAKTVVLQACYSGAFIDHHAKGKPAPSKDQGTTLRDVPNLIALAATAAERPSFGCSSGRARTYFGGAFGTALAQELGGRTGVSPTDVDWRRVYEQTAFAVSAMERVSASRPSEPGILENRIPAAR